MVIPESVTSIKTGAFNNCLGLTDVYYGGSESQYKSALNVVENYMMYNANLHFNSTGPEPDPTDPEPAEPQLPTKFNDVDADAAYAGAVSWAVGKKITKGTGSGAFSPDRTCMREEIVTFLYRAYK